MKKKIIHTSDWHLGKKLYQEDRTLEHEAYLNWLLEFANTHDVDVLLMSGDLFDSPNPPHSAQKAYYDFLAKWFSHSPQREAIILGGNHDSGPLINAPYSLLDSALQGGRLHLIGNFDPENWQDFVIQRPWGSVCALAYFRLHEILNLAKKLEINSAQHEEIESVRLLFALSRLLENWKQMTTSGLPSILMAHHVFGPYMASGSELGVPLSGLETIPLNVLGKWDYVALGHIHKPQVMNFENRPVVYSGSPLRMRFSEHEKKKISLITIDTQKNDLQYELVDIPAFRKLYRLRATKENFKEKILALCHEERQKKTTLTSFIEAELECDSPWIGAADEIRNEIQLALPGVEQADLPKLLAVGHRVQTSEGTESSSRERSPALNLAALNIGELFERYYAQKYPESREIPTDIKDLFHELLRPDQEQSVEQNHVH